MSLEGDISLIKRIPLFAELPTEQLRLLAFSSVRLELAEGQELFREGAPAAAGYVVSSGGIELIQGDGAREKKTTCEVGSLIGEIALFVETHRPATARAMMATELLEIERKQITRMLHEYPHLALRLRAKLAERLTATVSDLGQVRRALSRMEAAGGRR